MLCPPFVGIQFADAFALEIRRRLNLLTDNQKATRNANENGKTI